ncbi:hypothetical protein Tco_1076719 [Tanacetum coccineum]
MLALYMRVQTIVEISYSTEKFQRRVEWYLCTRDVQRMSRDGNVYMNVPLDDLDAVVMHEMFNKSREAFVYKRFQRMSRDASLYMRCSLEESDGSPLYRRCHRLFCLMDASLEFQRVQFLLQDLQHIQVILRHLLEMQSAQTASSCLERLRYLWQQ